MKGWDRARVVLGRLFGLGVESPEKAWAGLLAEDRAKALALARVGRPHGVPIVRRTAAAWAAAVLARRPLRSWLGEVAASVVGGASAGWLAAYLLGRNQIEYVAGWSAAAFVGASLRLLLMRRRARRVLAANAEPPEDDVVALPGSEDPVVAGS